MRIAILALPLGMGCPSGPPTDTDPVDTDVPLTYASDWDGVQQLFVDHCDECHPSQNGFDLRQRLTEDLANGTGFYVVPGEPENSRIWGILTGSVLAAMMPPSGFLPHQDVGHVEQWILDGATIP